MTAGPTPSHTVGPYFHIGMRWDDGADVVAADHPGAVWLRGRVLDGDGGPVDDALIETWQADAHGVFAHPDDPRDAEPGFRAFGRVPTDDAGAWAVRTIKPGAVPNPPDGPPFAPHVLLVVFARGMLRHVMTRVYFPDEDRANAADPLLARLAPDVAATMIAQATTDGYALDLRLQGDDATYFYEPI